MDAGEIDPELERDALGHLHIKMKEEELNPVELQELMLQESRINSKLEALDYQAKH